MLRTSILWASRSSSSLTATRASSARALRSPVLYSSIRCQHEQKRQAHAISNPTLANIESRWDTMPPQEQADLWMALRDRMKNDWHELTLQEKKACMYSPFSLFILYPSYSKHTIPHTHQFYSSCTNLAFHSILDRFWPTWASCRSTAWRRLENFPWHYIRRHHLSHRLRYNKVLRTTRPEDNEQRVAGSFE